MSQSPKSKPSLTMRRTPSPPRSRVGITTSRLVLLLLQVTLVLLMTYYCIFWYEMESHQHHQYHQHQHHYNQQNMIFSNHPQQPQPQQPQQIDRETSNSKRPNKPKATIAYLTTITACPAQSKSHLVDAAAVLKHSIHRVSFQNYAESHSLYDYQMYVLMHPEAAPDCRDDFVRIGYRVFIRDTPVSYHEVQNNVTGYRDILFNPKEGCCGEKELLKLYTYTMLEYPVAVHLDLDFLLLKPMDELFDAMLAPDDQIKYIPRAMRPWDQRRTRRIESMFTRDYPMSVAGQKPERVGMQGGLLIARPNQTAFDELLNIVRRGNFKRPRGWFDGDVSYPDFYGAPQIQGLLGFFYGHYHPEQTVELNRCYFNNMVDNPRDRAGNCRAPVGDHVCENCREKNITEIYSAHFTFCKKPHECVDEETYNSPIRIFRARLCLQLHQAWHQTRYDLERQLGIAKPYNTSDPSYGHCLPGRVYVPIDFQSAQ